MLPVEEVAGTSYTFTSRGPTPDGWMPTLCATAAASRRRACLPHASQMRMQRLAILLSAAASTTAEIISDADSVEQELAQLRHRVRQLEEEARGRSPAQSQLLLRLIV